MPNFIPIGKQEVSIDHWFVKLISLKMVKNQYFRLFICFLLSHWFEIFLKCVRPASLQKTRMLIFISCVVWKLLLKNHKSIIFKLLDRYLTLITWSDLNNSYCIRKSVSNSLMWRKLSSYLIQTLPWSELLRNLIIPSDVYWQCSVSCPYPI